MRPEEKLLIQAKTTSEIFLDARAGVTLQQLLSDLEADVEWGSNSLGEEVVQGSYCGSKEAIAQAVLGDFNYVILRDHARLRVIVINRIPKIGATNNGARVAPLVMKKTGQASRPPQSRAEKNSRRGGSASRSSVWFWGLIPPSEGLQHHLHRPVETGILRCGCALLRRGDESRSWL